MFVWWNIPRWFARPKTVTHPLLAAAAGNRTRDHQVATPTPSPLDHRASHSSTGLSELSRSWECAVCGGVVQGYRVRRSYIASQAPLIDTTEDFWRMLWEHSSNIVVMLCTLRDHVTGRVSHSRTGSLGHWVNQCERVTWVMGQYPWPILTHDPWTDDQIHQISRTVSQQLLVLDV